MRFLRLRFFCLCFCCLRYFCVCIIVLLTPLSAAHGLPTGDNASAVLAAQAFVAEATRQYGDAVRFRVHPPAPATRLPPCSRHEIFLPADTKLWGQTRVGVKCSNPTQWTAFLAVSVNVSGGYLVSARKINRGQTVTESDFEIKHGDLTTLPESTLTDPRQAVGQRAKVSLAAQQPLRRTHLHQSPVIRQGDKVRILARGAGFSASVDGVALNNAAEGEAIKVRISSGRTLSGTARLQGVVELPP